MTISIWCVQILRWATQEVHKENYKSAFSPVLRQGAGNKWRSILTKSFPLENRVGGYKSKSVIASTEKEAALHTCIAPQCLNYCEVLQCHVPFWSKYASLLLWLHRDLGVYCVCLSKTELQRNHHSTVFRKDLKYQSRAVQNLGTICCPLQGRAQGGSTVQLVSSASCTFKSCRN